MTQGKYAIVDLGDFERLNRYKWHAARCRDTFYAKRVVHVGEDKKRVIIKMHREIIRVGDDMFVDHINHNGLNNRRANLRPATRTENNRNRRKAQRRNYSSRYKGLTWYREQERWIVRITVNRKSEFIGSFKNELEAARAYDRAAVKYHGEFASLNFGY